MHHKKVLGLFIIVFFLTNFLSTPLFSLINFASGAPGSWWNLNWIYRKAITIDHTKVAGPLSSFPVLINMTDNDLATYARADGGDIVFTDYSGTKLNHEIESYDTGTGHLVCWVNLPNLSPTVDTTIYIYYDNPASGNQQNPKAVWDSNYMMVQHLNAGVKDSTVNGNNGTLHGTVFPIAGEADGAYQFDGATGYLEIPHSNTLTGYTTGFTASFWIRFADVSRRQVILNKYDSSGNQRAWFIEYDNSGSKFPSFFASATGSAYSDWYSTYSPVVGNWYYVTVVWQSNLLPKFYVNGQQVSTFNSATIPQIFNNPGAPLDIGKSTYVTGRNLNGGLDEICLSNNARSANWILTSYNNQAKTSKFYNVGPAETSTGGPQVSNETPADGTLNAYTNPILSISASDNNPMTVIFLTNASGTWQNLTTYANVASGTYSYIPTGMNKLNTKYFWSVNVADGTNWTNRTYSFTTTSTVLTQMWLASGVPNASIGALVADLFNDGHQEVVHAGQGGVTVLNGTNGQVIWSRNVVGADIACQLEISDINNDGKPEILVPIYFPAGIEVLFGNGTTYWRRDDLGGVLSPDIVTADIDGKGYKTIFAPMMWTYPTNNDSTIDSLSYDGKILHQVHSWHPCAGGLSIADTQNDGNFELFVGDRNTGYEGFSGGDGRGLRAFWASNLTEIWAHPEILCSSNRPMLADVNNDGKLEVIIGYHRGGIGVFNAITGSAIREDLNLYSTVSVHYQPSVYDIDGDGHLEFISSDGEHHPEFNVTIFDLVTWQLKARINVTPGKYGPQVADLTGDGQMDIILTNDDNIMVYEYNLTTTNYDLVGQATGLRSRLMNSVVQDIDGDGYNEVVVATEGGSIYAFKTPARTPIPRPRSEIRFYSERRNGVQIYVPPPGATVPIVSDPLPTDGATNVPISLSQLSFRLVDFHNNPMNYTVATIPNIGSGSGTKLLNGVQTVSISNLQYGVTYTWQVNVTDGTGWANKTLTFKTQNIPPWWNTDWQYRKAIVIDPSKVNGNLTDFPVLVDLTYAGLTNKTQSNGNDFVFTDGTQAKLSHEIEQYDNSTGHLTAWVKIPFLSSSVSTLLYMYYGNPTCGNQQNKTVVWDSSNRMVLHLDEKTGTQYDSTVNGNNGTANNGVIQGIAGKIDGSDTFNGVNGYVQVAHSDTLSGYTEALTASFWLRLDDVSRRQTILGKYNSATGQRSWYVEYQANQLGFFASQDGTNYQEWHASFTPIAGTWYYVTVVWQNSTVPNFYVNGVQLTTTGTSTITSIYNNAGVPLYIGRCQYDATRYLKGALDEIRISNPARSVGWILTCYNNQQNPSTFYQVGTEEALPSAPLVTNPNPADGTVGVPIDLASLSFNLTDYQHDSMSYYVTTTPDVGSNTTIGVGNGEYYVNVTGLQEATAYSWQLNVTDGTHWTNMTFTFTTESHKLQLLADSTFDNSVDSADLIANGPGQDWYESRNNVPTLLFLDTSNIGGDATKKAGFTASASGNAYLTQEFSTPQTGTFTVQWDIYVASILNVSPYCAGQMLIGDASGAGPNRAGRFVYMSFYKSGGGTSGTMSLVRGQSSSTVIADGLNLGQWYTIKVIVNVAAGTYDVYVNGVFKATVNANSALTSLTYISFAQWNDGAGAFYVDNASAYVEVVNQAPIIDSYYPTTDPTIIEGKSQEFNVTYHDPEGDATTIQWYLNGTPTITADSYTFTATSGSAGTYDVNVTITDKHGAQTSRVWKLSVFVTLPPLLVDSEFNNSVDSADLIANGPGQDWYESRGMYSGGNSSLLFLDTSNIGGDATKKAGFIADQTANAYLSQEFSLNQTGVFTAQWDIYINSILNVTPYQAGQMMIGRNSGTGPNRNSADRFVYMYFKQGGTSSTMNLVASGVTIVTGLNLGQWYTIKVIVNVAAGTYDVYVNGVFEATVSANAALATVTCISFAQWNDGAGAFYVDNVFAPAVDTYKLTVTTDGHGSVTVDPGESSYLSGTVVSLTPNADFGYVFDHWEVNGVPVGSTVPYLITMDANKTVTAFFHTQ